MDYNNLNTPGYPTNGEHTISMTAFIPTLRDEFKFGYRLSRTIRLLTFLDVFLGLFMLFFGNAGLLIFVRIICSLCGYYGSKSYNYCLTSIYSSFIMFSTIGEVLLVFLYNREYKDGNITQDTLMIGILYQFIYFMLKIYILRFVCKFMSFIKELTDHGKSELTLYDSQPVEIVYW